MARYLAVFGGGHLPSCKPDGSFKSLQCYEQECWCVNEQTGNEIRHTRTKVPDTPDCECKYFTTALPVWGWVETGAPQVTEMVKCTGWCFAIVMHQVLSV